MYMTFYTTNSKAFTRKGIVTCGNLGCNETSLEYPIQVAKYMSDGTAAFKAERKLRTWNLTVSV